MKKFEISPTYSEIAASTDKYLKRMKNVEFVIVFFIPKSSMPLIVSATLPKKVSEEVLSCKNVDLPRC